MKRIITALLLTFALILSLTSCPLNQESNEDLIKLNELYALIDDNYVLVINVESEGGNKVTKEYTVSTENHMTSVHEKIEEINTFSVNEDDITVPDSYKTKTERDLTHEEIINGSFNAPDFKFSSTNLSSVATVTGALYANVASTEGLMGITLNASNVKLIVKYTDAAIQTISVNYTTSQNDKVTITYTFN